METSAWSSECNVQCAGVRLERGAVIYHVECHLSRVSGVRGTLVYLFTLYSTTVLLLLGAARFVTYLAISYEAYVCRRLSI